MMRRPSSPSATPGPVHEELARLGRILALEASRGYTDRVVIGGLSGYVEKLRARLPERARRRFARFLVAGAVERRATPAA